MSVLQDVLLIIKDVSRIAAGMVETQVNRATEAGKEALNHAVKLLLAGLAAVIIALSGLVFVLRGAYVILAAATGPAASAFILGAVLLVIAVIVFLIAAKT
jgi:hypothetical protein